MFKIIPSKKKKGLCTAYRCGNAHTPKDRFCSKHRHRFNKEKDPVKYTFNRKKSNSRRRGIPWNLSLPEFRQFCEETGYMDKKGRTAFAASIDRIDPTRGYEIGNLQLLSLSDNTKKMHEDNKECPF